MLRFTEKPWTIEEDLLHFVLRDVVLDCKFFHDRGEPNEVINKHDRATLGKFRSLEAYSCGMVGVNAPEGFFEAA
jgi:hypothetical protein